MRRFPPHDGELKTLEGFNVQVIVATNEVVRRGLRHIGDEVFPFLTMLEACNCRRLSARYLGDDKLKKCQLKRGDVCGLKYCFPVSCILLPAHYSQRRTGNTMHYCEAA
jgi:hypothetical protein